MLVDNTNKDAAFIDIASPLTNVLQATNAEEQHKYQEMQCKPRNNDSCYIITLVSSAKAITPSMLEQSLTRLRLTQLTQAEKVSVLNTCSSVRRFLNKSAYLTKMLQILNHVILLTDLSKMLPPLHLLQNHVI